MEVKDPVKRKTSKFKVGDVFTNKLGKSYEVVEYKDSNTVKVRFIESGWETTATAANVRTGVGDRSNLIKVGQEFKTRQGCTVKVLSVISQVKIEIEYLDEHMHKTFTDSKSLKMGSLKNPYHPEVCGVGFLGIGDYPCSEYDKFGKKRNSKAYEVWRGILRRCYNTEHQNINPTYKGCTVSAEWHNFQNFAGWFYSHPFRKDGWELDKDLIKRGNKIYDEKYCTFVPQELNAAPTDSRAKRGDYPVGVYFKKDVGKFRAQIARYGSNQEMLLESYDLRACALAYKVAKEEYMRELASVWKGKVDDRVIETLNSWVGEVTV